MPTQIWPNSCFFFFHTSVVDPDPWEPVSFWASWISIRHYLYGSGSGFESRSFHHQAKQVKNPWFLLFCDFFMTLWTWYGSADSDTKKNHGSTILFAFTQNEPPQGKTNENLTMKLQLMWKCWQTCTCTTIRKFISAMNGYGTVCVPLGTRTWIFSVLDDQQK